MATDGAVAVRKARRGGTEVLVISKPTRIAIEEPDEAVVEAFDEDGKALGTVATAREGHRLVFSHAEGAASHIIK